jgi:hypothetical protein
MELRTGFFCLKKRVRKLPEKGGIYGNLLNLLPEKGEIYGNLLNLLPEIHGHLNGENDRIRWGTLHFSWENDG